MANGTTAQEVTTEDWTILKVYHNDTPGPNWTPYKDDLGNDKPYEPSSKVLAVPWGSPENTANSEFKMKPPKFWMRALLRPGRSFTVAIKRGVTNGHEWAHFEDLVAELDAEGNMKRIPEASKSLTAAPTPPPGPQAAKPVASKPQGNGGGPKAPTPPTTPQKPAEPPKPRPKPSEAFMNSCFIPQTDKFWLMQSGFDEDGMMMAQAHRMALEAAKHICGWRNQAYADNGLVTEGDFQVEFKKWSDYFEAYLSHARWTKERARFACLLANCATKEQVIALVERAWAKLPRSHYDLFTEQARTKLDDLNQKIEVDPETVPTGTPDIPIIVAEELEIPETVPAPATPVPPEPEAKWIPDQGLIDYTINAIGKLKIQKEATEKLVDFWSTTMPALKEVPEVAKVYTEALEYSKVPF